MNKNLAHIFLWFLDLASVWWVYYSISAWNNILQDINMGVNSIGFQWPVWIFFILLIIPIIHVFALYCKKWVIVVYKELMLLIFVCIVVIPVFYFNSKISSKLSSHDYIYDVENSTRMTFSIFKNYIKKHDIKKNELQKNFQ